MNEINQDNWIDYVVEDCKAIFVERNYNEREEKIRCNHEIGTRIIEEYARHDEKTYGHQITEKVAKSIKKGQRTVQRMVQVVKARPDVEEILKDKAITWNKVLKEVVGVDEEILPALPDKKYIADVIRHNAEFLAENLTQKKKGISLYLPYDYIDATI